MCHPEPIAGEPMVTRREWLGLTAAAGAALALDPYLLHARQQPLLTRPVPSSGEQLPLVGLGSSDSFGRIARNEDFAAVGEVLKTMVEIGGKVFDTAPGYGASEEVAGKVAQDLGITNRIF